MVHSRNGDKSIHESRSTINRRTFLAAIGWGSISAAAVVFLLGIVRAMRPGVLYEPPTMFKADKPENYPEGSPTLIPEEKVFIDRDEKGIYAMSAICTHLGCRVLWMESQNGYHCPCHGAQFDREGTNIEGPAPRPLPRFGISKDRDGKILVDKAEEVRREFRLTG